jgi:hypothetical protein
VGPRSAELSAPPLPSPGSGADLGPDHLALDLDPSHYERHALHRDDRTWTETNCYVDLWIEILSSAGLEPAAALAFTFAADFEGDQWTFFKFPLGDLQRLYGVDTQELSIWRAPHLHALEQVERGRIVLMEMDSYYLPDTAGTAYGKEHVKTTVGIEQLDLERRRLGYFHNAGYYAVEGDDFEHLFRFEEPWTSGSNRLLPYTEFAKFDALTPRSEAELRAVSLELAREHARRIPKQNPFVSYKPRFMRDLEWLRASPAEAFHQYAFVSIRQFGACFELAADYCKWLGVDGQLDGQAGLQVAATAFGSLAQQAKALQFKIARTVTLKRAFDPAPALDQLASDWEQATSAVARHFG